VSRTHCEIEVIDNTPWIKDINSAWGTYLNGKQITKSVLKAGDIINIGNLYYCFQEKHVKRISQTKEKTRRNSQDPTPLL